MHFVPDRLDAAILAAGELFSFFMIMRFWTNRVRVEWLAWVLTFITWLPVFAMWDWICLTALKGGFHLW